MTAADQAAWVRPRSPRWPAAVAALTTTRRGAAAEPCHGLGGWNLAAHVGDRPAVVAANRRALQERAGIEAIQWLNQVHGTRVVRASAATAGEAPQADAAWTAQAGLGLAVLTADCVPVIVAERGGAVVGVAHGGWRGLVGGVLQRLVEALPAPPDTLIAWLGPAIGPSAYEVGEEVVAAVRALPDGPELVARCVRPGRAGRGFLDLFTLSEQLLHRAGVTAVTSERLCTHTDARFFSYRRDGSTGRMATLAWLRGSEA